MAPSATTTKPTTETTETATPVVKAATSSTSNRDLGFESGPTRPPAFEDKYVERKYLKHRLVLAFRVFAQFGFCEGVAGHLTARDPVDPNNFWVNPFGLHFSIIEDDDLLLVNHDGKVIDGGRNRLLNTAAFAIHSEIHAARPDVICAAHSHSIYGRAFCSTGRTLSMITQDSCNFYNDHVLYPTFNGVVLAAEEGKAIARTLGGKKAALLGNHGLLTCGKSIEEATNWFVLLDKCCEIQIAADASSAGSGIPLTLIGEIEARETRDALGTSDSGYFQGLPLFQVAERTLGEKTYMGRGLESL